jgi:hypothetical protein
MTFCLVIQIACPDYKRPDVNTELYFFETKEEVLLQIKKSKISFIADFDTSEDPRIETLIQESPDVLLQEIFEQVSDPDYFYRDSYMDREPFISQYFKISETSRGNAIII